MSFFGRTLQKNYAICCSTNMQIVFKFIFYGQGHTRERDMAQWLERGALPMSLLQCGFESRLVQNFQRILCFSSLNLGTLLRCCVLGQGTSPSNASLESGENEYLAGQT